ncbi:MAG: SMC-Scp complex subunit ScpB [Thermoanaerobaculia bacterium]|jgi:segregation and condensation protein B|nr:SMC-Scp complex subunit ScpB [Thermoanaerobaculia bacterium]MCZ7650795.1 SMC-Scp complex subunit ScpB [Thermoanaerobaculia bacterium]
MSDARELESVFEALLFVSGEPVPRERLLGLVDAADRTAAGAALARLEGRYRQRPHAGIFLEEVAGGLRLVTRPELHPYLRRFFDSGGGNRLSMAALETLAIIAYRQPITGPEIQELRGKSPAGVLRGLLEKRLIRISGRKEVVGRPFLYATTREFLMHFGLRDLDELPPLEEFEESFGGEASGLEERPAERLDERPEETSAEPSGTAGEEMAE